MNRVLFFLVTLLLSPYFVKSQSFMGMHLFRNEAISVGLFNPALVSTSNVKFQASGLGADLSFENNYLKTSRSLYSISNNGRNDFRGYFEEQLNGNDKDLFAKIEFRPIAVMLSIDKIGAFTFGTRFRLLSGITNVSEPLATSIYRHETAMLDWVNNFSSPNFGAAINAVSEVSLGYSNLFFENTKFKLYGGFSIKGLLPVFTGFAKARNVQFDHDVNNQRLTTGTTNFEFVFSDTREKAFVDGAEQSVASVMRLNGAAVDFGIAGVWDYSDEINVRGGISITDLGSYRFNASSNSRRFVSSGVYVPESAVFNFATQEYYNLDTIMSELGTFEKVTGAFKHRMPTRLNIHADVKYKNWLFGYMANYNLISTNGRVAGAFLPTNHMISAGIEKELFGASIPVSYNSFRQLGLGLVLHSKYLTVGTTNLVSSMFMKNSSAVNIFFSLNFIKLIDK